MAVDMAGLPPWPIVRVEVVREDVLDRELHQAQIPELVGTSEVIKLLGVTRQRLHELRTAGRFPLPTLELAAGPIWMRPAIEQFAAERNRRPGRPKTVQDILGEADELQAQLGNLGTG
jgi:acetamidase/formamidase